MKVLAVTNMYPTPAMPAFGTFIESEVESLRREGIEVDLLFINGRKNTINYLWGIPRLWAKLLTHRYDVIHAHYVFSGFIARAQILYPVVLTHHGVEVFRGWQSVPCRIITPLVDRVIVRSQEMKRRLRCDEAEVIPAGIDFTLFKPLPQQECRQLLELPLDKKLILWAGEYFRLEKRFDIVKEAVSILRQRVSNAELVLVTGKPHSTMPLYMNACDVLLLVSDVEGSPNVVKEAMACNLPIVSVPVGDVPQIVEGCAGCYLCSQDPQDVAQTLEKALEWGKRTNGRERVQYLDLAEISRRIVNVYEKTLTSRSIRTVVWGKNLLNHRYKYPNRPPK
jgi:teichuronic acid biosynthesis glycosyltransferase TuaC